MGAEDVPSGEGFWAVGTLEGFCEAEVMSLIMGAPVVDAGVFYGGGRAGRAYDVVEVGDFGECQFLLWGRRVFSPVPFPSRFSSGGGGCGSFPANGTGLERYVGFIVVVLVCFSESNNTE